MNPLLSSKFIIIFFVCLDMFVNSSLIQITTLWIFNFLQYLTSSKFDVVFFPNSLNHSSMLIYLLERYNPVPPFSSFYTWLCDRRKHISNQQFHFIRQTFKFFSKIYNYTTSTNLFLQLFVMSFQLFLSPSHEQKTEKAREGRNKNMWEKRKKSFTSSWCRASVEKAHSSSERHSALSILSATKDEEGERRNLIDGGLRRKNLRQRRVSLTRISGMPERTRLLGLGTSGTWLSPRHFTSPLPIFPIHFPPHSPVYSCEVREREKEKLLSFSPFITFI